jgi:hypothetical protein
MNIAYKIKALLSGLCKMGKRNRINSIYCFIHFRKTYKYERGWFFDVLGNGRNNSYGAWQAVGMIPQALVFGLFELLKNRIRGIR